MAQIDFSRTAMELTRLRLWQAKVSCVSRFILSQGVTLFTYVLRKYNSYNIPAFRR